MDKQTLKGYRALCREIELLAAEKENLLAGSLGAVKITGMPKRYGISNPTSETAARIAEITGELDSKLREYIFLRSEIETAIGNLAEPRDRELMRRRYIEGQSWEEIAVAMSYSINHIWRIHGYILQKIK
jgi:hypothetical protein